MIEVNKNENNYKSIINNQYRGRSINRLKVGWVFIGSYTQYFSTMRNKIKNKLRMYQAVRRVIQSNNASWNGLVAFENAVTRFSQKVTELENLTYSKSKAVLGMKSKRDKKREAIAEQALYVSNALFAFASTIQDEKLKADVNYTPTRLNYSPVSVFLQIVNGLIDRANENASDLEDYGVDQNMIDNLTLEYMEFIEISNLPRQAIVSRKVITQQINETVMDIDEVLKSQLDRLIVLLTKDDPTFVMTYEGSRTIIDTPATRRSKTYDDEDTIEGSDFPEDVGNNSP